MKKLLIVMLSVVACVCLCLFAACGNGESKTNESVAVESITLNKSEITLTVGEDETLTATVSPDNATDKTVTWESSDASVATVTGGKVTAVMAGEATITAKSGDKSATCSVTVNAAVTATAMTEEEWVEYWTSFENAESYVMVMSYIFNEEVDDPFEFIYDAVNYRFYLGLEYAYHSYDIDKHIHYVYRAEIDENTGEYEWETRSYHYFNAEDTEESFTSFTFVEMFAFIRGLYEYLTFDGIDTYSGIYGSEEILYVIKFENGEVKSIERTTNYEDDGEICSWTYKFEFSDINNTVVTIPQEALDAAANGFEEHEGYKRFYSIDYTGTLEADFFSVEFYTNGEYRLYNATDEYIAYMCQYGTYTVGEDGALTFTAIDGTSMQLEGVWVDYGNDLTLTISYNGQSSDINFGCW